MVTSKFVKMLVENSPGVLDRVTGIIRRHGWNIESLTVAEIAPGTTQMNFSINGKAVDIDILSRNLSDLDFVKSWEECTERTHLFRETVIIKMKKSDLEKAEGAGMLCENDGIVVVEYLGTPKEIDHILLRLSSVMLACDRSGAMSIKIEEAGDEQ